jgi:hypothetical protein
MRLELVMRCTLADREARLAEDRVRDGTAPLHRNDQPRAVNWAAAFRSGRGPSQASQVLAGESRQGSKMCRFPNRSRIWHGWRPTTNSSSPLFFRLQELFLLSRAAGWKPLVLAWKLVGKATTAKPKNGFEAAYPQALCAEGALPASGSSGWARSTHSGRSARPKTGLEAAEEIGALCCH